MRQPVCTLILVALVSGPFAARASAQRAESAGIPVRFPEGVVHGFLALHTAAGAVVASGDLYEIPQNGLRNGFIESRMIFHFADSSIFEETVTFSQRETFALQSYRLVQRGPAFENELDASFSRDGRYAVKSTSRASGKESHWEGTLALPADIADGLVIVLLKNLKPKESRVVPLLAFTPEPRLIQLELSPTGQTRVMNGSRPETVVEYRLKPHIGGLTGFLARLSGKMPPDSHVWVVTTEVPAFLRFEGPLYLGPVWRIDLTTPLLDLQQLHAKDER